MKLNTKGLKLAGIKIVANPRSDLYSCFVIG